MRINGKSEEISATWPIETSARIYLSYKFSRFEPQSLDLIGSEGLIYPLNATVDRVYLFDRSYIAPSDRNEVIILENDVDTRKLFIIADATEDRRFLEAARSEQLADLPQFEAQT